MNVKCCKCGKEYLLEDNIFEKKDTTCPILICPHCDFKHICIGDDGKCKAYVPNTEAHGRRSRTVQPLVGASGSPK